MTTFSNLNEPLNNSALWDVPLNNNFTIIDGYLTQTTAVTITTSDVTLTPSTSATPNTSGLGQLQCYLINLTGALTGNRALIIPTTNPAPAGGTNRGRWIIANATTNTGGPWTVTVQVGSPASGATVVVPQGYSTTVYCDGTNVYLADNGLLQGGFPATFSTYSGANVPRVVAGSAASATQSPNGDTTDVYVIDGLSTAITTFNAPSGTPVNGQKMIIRIIDNGTARAISGWSSSYATIGTTLPTTTVLGKYTYIGCIYNSNSSKWDVVSVGQQT